jgi:hypothetical protein
MERNNRNIPYEAPHHFSSSSSESEELEDKINDENNEIRQWLKRLGIAEKCWEKFRKEGCVSFELLAEVEEKDLDDLEIPKYPKRAILKKIEEFKQVHLSMLLVPFLICIALNRSRP